MAALSNMLKLRRLIHPLFKNNFVCVRYLYGHDVLQLTDFKARKNYVLAQLGVNREKFFEMVKDATEKKGSIFTKDFRLQILLTETDEELQLLFQTRELYKEQQKKTLFPSHYRSAKHILQMLYVNNKVSTAFEWFQDERTTIEHDAANPKCFLLVMDMMYEAGRYDDVISLMANVDVYLNKPFAPIFVLYFAALYRKNTKTALSQTMSRLQDYCEKEIPLPNRCMYLCAMLAYNQGDYRTMLEMLELPVFTYAKHSRFSRADNLQMLALIELGRLEECLSALNAVLINVEKSKSLIFSEVIERLSEAIEEKGTMEMKEKFYTTNKSLRGARAIAENSIHNFICDTIREKEYLVIQDLYNPKFLKLHKGFTNQQQQQVTE